MSDYAKIAAAEAAWQAIGGLTSADTVVSSWERPRVEKDCRSNRRSYHYESFTS